MGISYMDDNSTAVGENGADSRAMNPNNIVERQSADSSENTPMTFSGDPIIEANLQANAQKQNLLIERMKSSQMSGAGNQDSTETGEGAISHAARQEQ
jgi:hypothetical protein